MTVSRQYSEEEAAAILRLASQTSVTGSVTRESLESMASEIGVSPEALERAEQQFLEQKLAEEEQAREKKERRREFGRKVGLGIATVLALGFFIAAKQGGVSFSPTPLAALFVLIWLSKRGSTRTRRGAYARTLDPTTKQVLDDIALREPSKIQAIRDLRERLNLSLVDAKEAVETYDVQNGPVFR